MLNQGDGRVVMTALATRLFPRASAQSIADFEAFTSVALFCGIGLLVALTAIVLDQQLPGEWF